MTDLRWARVRKDRFALQKLYPGVYSKSLGATQMHVIQSYWFSCAYVFKAKKGDRWIVRVGHRLGLKYDQYAVHSLREAMRLAKFLVRVKYD